MSQLTIQADVDVSDEPRILSFQAFASERSHRHLTADSRARAEFHNRCCTICNRVTVESIELRNGRIGRNGRMIPGTGTLVGFCCNSCGHEWPA